MSNCVEFGDKIAFHPGYYIKELVEDSGLTQEEFAKRLDTTPKNLSILIRGEQRLSTEMAMKLSRMVGTSAAYWLNLQNAYDAIIAEQKSAQELVLEKEVLKKLGYKYFFENFKLPDLPRKTDRQIEHVRAFLHVSTLGVLEKREMAACYRGEVGDLSEESVIKANAMVQIATNIALKTDAPKFDKIKFEGAAKYALTIADKPESIYPQLKEAFREAGVVYVVLPGIPGAGISGATKKIGNKILLMVSNRGKRADLFRFALFHEIGHLMNGDYGISFDEESGE